MELSLADSLREGEDLDGESAPVLSLVLVSLDLEVPAPGLRVWNVNVGCEQAGIS